MRQIYKDGNIIKIPTPDLSCQYPRGKKLDLLYYNNVNDYGEALKTLVYNSGLKDVEDTSHIIYDPNSIYNNTPIESIYTISGSSNRWSNASILSVIPSMVKNEDSYIEPRYNIATDFSVPSENYNNMYDGWYTQTTIVLQDYHTKTIPGTISYYNSSLLYLDINNDWRPLYDIISETPIYSLPGYIGMEFTTEYDFFVTTKTLGLYKKLLDNKLDGEWATRISAIAPKLRSILSNVEIADYATAQYLLNSMSISLLSNLI